MRIPRTAVLAALILSGCGGDGMPPTGSAGSSTPSAPIAPNSPTPPSPTTPQAGASADTLVSLWGMVVESSGVCITGATVQRERGGSLDTAVGQDPACDAWAYGGGFTLRGLAPNVEITLLVSAPGYASREVRVTPIIAQRAVEVIELARVEGNGPIPGTSGTLERVEARSAAVR